MQIDTQYFKNRLLELRQELTAVAATADDAARPVELDQSRVGRLSRMDAMQAQAMSIEMKRRREIQLQRIGSALARIDDGRFGLCLRCDDEIAEQRLSMDPTAVMCIACANEAESRD